MTNKNMGILLGIICVVMVVFGFLFKAEIKEKIDAVRDNVPAVTEDAGEETPATQSIEAYLN